MKLKKENFNEFYLQKVKPKIYIMEQMRSKLANTFFLINGLFSFCWFYFWYSNLDMATNVPHNLIIIGGIPMLVGFLSFKYVFKQFKASYKEKIIPLLFEQVFDNFSYDPNQFLNESDYHSTLLYQDKYNRYFGEDLIEGKFNNCPIKMSELKVSHVTQSGKNRHERIIFKGIIAILTLPHNKYMGETIIEPDIAEKYFGFIGKMIQEKTNSNHPVVRLESIDFEKNFVVHSNDQVEARKILTPHVQEKIMTLSKKSSFKFSFSIIQNQLSISIISNTNYFEPSYFSSEKNYKMIRDMVDIFLFIEDLIKINFA